MRPKSNNQSTRRVVRKQKETLLAGWSVCAHQWNNVICRVVCSCNPCSEVRSLVVINRSRWSRVVCVCMCGLAAVPRGGGRSSEGHLAAPSFWGLYTLGTSRRRLEMHFEKDKMFSGGARVIRKCREMFRFILQRSLLSCMTYSTLCTF